MQVLSVMLQDWTTELAAMDPVRQEYYNEIRQRSAAFDNIPTSYAKGLQIDPHDFDAFLMACVFKADRQYRLTPFSFELYEYYLKSFTRRFKNPVVVWYHTAVLHCWETLSGKNGHFRLIEEASYQYGA
jgi:hypothetical protein